MPRFELEALRVVHRRLRVVPLLERFVTRVLASLGPFRGCIRVDSSAELVAAGFFDRLSRVGAPSHRRLPPRLDHLPRGRRELVLAADDAFGEEFTVDAPRDVLSDFVGFNRTFNRILRRGILRRRQGGVRGVGFGLRRHQVHLRDDSLKLDDEGPVARGVDDGSEVRELGVANAESHAPIRLDRRQLCLNVDGAVDASPDLRVLRHDDRGDSHLASNAVLDEQLGASHGGIDDEDAVGGALDVHRVLRLAEICGRDCARLGAALALADDELGGEIGGVPLEPRVLRLTQRLALAPLLRLRRGPGRVATRSVRPLRPLQSLRLSLLALLDLQLGRLLRGDLVPIEAGQAGQAGRVVRERIGALARGHDRPIARVAAPTTM
mmetsp:Transcript_3052/g.12057  ORF Transcript_3052/g.12057 Transcript_3052/m.12057 type:complete len:380 (-) Transcript_3052:8-1147(-)